MISPVKEWRRQKSLTPLLGAVGKVITYSTIHVPHPEHKKLLRYVTVLVELANGKRMVGQLSDTTDVKTGMEVRATLRIINNSSSEELVRYGLKFVPV